MLFKRKEKAVMPLFEAADRLEQLCATLTLHLARLREGDALTDEERGVLRALRDNFHLGMVLTEHLQRRSPPLPASPSAGLLCPLRGVECTACAAPCDMGN